MTLSNERQENVVCMKAFGVSKGFFDSRKWNEHSFHNKAARKYHVDTTNGLCYNLIVVFSYIKLRKGNKIMKARKLLAAMLAVIIAAVSFDVGEFAKQSGEEVQVGDEVPASGQMVSDGDGVVEELQSRWDGYTTQSIITGYR